MFGRKRARQSRELLEYLAKTQSDHRKRLVDQSTAADEKNAALEAAKNSLERLLSDALATDSYIDLDILKKAPRTPAFDGKQPRRNDYLPAAPSAFQSLLPWKRSAYRDQYQAAEARFDRDRQNFRDAFYEHQALVDREQAEVDAHNAEVETYKQDFAAGEPYAIANYFELILESSAYPDGFPRQTDIEFTAERQELRVEFSLPTPDVIPDTRHYAYDATRDEIVAAALSNKRRRRLYISMLAQISLRAVHELFTADRTEKLDRIVFSGYVEGINPSSGQEGRFCLVALAITRQQYESLDLQRVDPLSCLAGLGARLSSKPDQMQAVSPAHHAETQDSGDGPQTAQPDSELQGRIQAQADHIAELERKLEAHRDRIAILQPALRDERARNAELQGELEKQTEAIVEHERQHNVQFTRHAVLATELRDERERNAELQGEVQRQRVYIAALEDRLDAGNAEIARPDDSAIVDSDDTQPTEAVSESTADGEFAEAGMFAPIADETEVDGAGGGVPVPPREGEARNTGITVSLRSLLVDTADDEVSQPSATDDSNGDASDLVGQSGLAAPDILMDTVGDPQSDSARLLAMMMKNRWRVRASALDAAFPGEFVDVIVDDINERANDSIGENLIFYEDEELVANEDYCHDIETIISQSEYANLRHNIQ